MCLLTTADLFQSVPLPHVARQNVQLVAIFGNGAAGNRDPAFAENLNDFLVAQRIFRIFAFHQVGDGALDAGIAHRFARGGLVSGREEILHFEHAMFQRPLPAAGPVDFQRKRAWTNKQVSNAKLRELGWTPRFPSFFDAIEIDPGLLQPFLR